MHRSEQNTPAAQKAALDVLIVEDEMLIAFDLEFQVEAAGHRVVGLAQNLDTCKDVVRKSIPDVALMDMRLKGGESGADVARWLRDELNVRCIFVSGNLDDAQRERLKDLDPVAFIGKPVLPVQLTKVLTQFGAKNAE